MEHFAIARRSSPRPAKSVLIEVWEITELVADHTRIHRICAMLDASAHRANLSATDRAEIAQEVENAFDMRIRVIDSVLSRLFGPRPEGFEDSILAKLLRRQIHDALDAKNLSEALILADDPPNTATLVEMLIEMEASVQHTLHLEVLALLMLLADRLTLPARHSLEQLLLFKR